MHRLFPRPPVVAATVVMMAAALLRGQDVPGPDSAVPGEGAPAAPLLRPGQAKPAPGGWVMQEEAARTALELGFSPAAEALLVGLLEFAGDDRARRRTGWFWSWPPPGWTRGGLRTPNRRSPGSQGRERPAVICAQA